MIVRAITLAGALSGAVGLSQFPEFSQQYLQRLSGAVDELRVMAVAFDLSATTAGLTRQEALAEIGGSAFQDDLRNTLSERLSRYDRLKSDYDGLSGASPLGRLARPWRFADPELSRRTWQEFRPAVPVTADGLICAGIGFGAGWLVLSLLFAGAGRVLRRRRIA